MKPAGARRIETSLSAWLVVLFLAMLVAGCGGGGDGGPPPVSPTAVFISGMPAEPLARMQTAQLGAKATYSDASVRDVTTTASWTTTDASVLTVSSTGLVTATGPGQAEVVASLGSASGKAAMQVVALPAAYFIDGVEYAFDYQLDAQGRVDSYSISQRPGLAYALRPFEDFNVTTCTGSLSGDYVCSRSAYHVGSQTMRGKSGWLTSETNFQEEDQTSGCGSSRERSYAYSAQGLASVSFGSSSRFHITGLPASCFLRVSSTRTSTLSYDTAGALIRIASGSGEDCFADPSYPYVVTCTPVPPSSVLGVTTDSQGRLQSAKDGTTVDLWNYAGTGLMEQSLSTVTDDQGVVKATTTRYAFDSLGWLTERAVRVESRGQAPSETRDSYAYSRVGSHVAEETFTQAEPSAFYPRAPQRIRYEWGRLPTEPTFVPRALTGLNGADYFGIISSHHRDSRAPYPVPPPVAPTFQVSTLAGSASAPPALVDGQGTTARFNRPWGIWADGDGNLLIADSQNYRVRSISAIGAVTTRPGTLVSFPHGVAMDRAGNVYVADPLDRTITRIDSSGVVSTYAGTAGVAGNVDGPALQARFGQPEGVATDAAGNVYVADAGNSSIRKIGTDGTVRTLAGSGQCGCVDGIGQAAQMCSPEGMAIDGAGTIFVADAGCSTIRKITPDGAVSTLAGNAGNKGRVDGLGAAARFDTPFAVALDRVGDIYVADTFNNLIRRVTPTGLVSTVAGSLGSGARDGPGLQASFKLPTGIAADAFGNLYVADADNNTIRKLSPVTGATGATVRAPSQEQKGL